MTVPHHSVTLAILAGGEGSRMGFPKAQIRIGGEPILRHLWRRFSWTGPTMLVTAPGRTRPEGAECFDREVVDPAAGQGPMRGLLTALEHGHTDRLIVGTVDMPEVTIHQLTFLVDRLEASTTFDAVMLSHHRELDPFPSIYRSQAKEVVRTLLETGARSMRTLGRHERVRVVPAPDWPQRVWTNLNVPADLLATRHLEGNDRVRQG